MTPLLLGIGFQEILIIAIIATQKSSACSLFLYKSLSKIILDAHAYTSVFLLLYHAVL